LEPLEELTREAELETATGVVLLLDDEAMMEEVIK